MLLIQLLFLFIPVESFHSSLKYYEPLSYEAIDLSRSIRSPSKLGHVRFNFTAFNRTFPFILEELSHNELPVLENAVTEFGDVSSPIDRSGFYKGMIDGDENSSVFGSISDGVFEGMIRLSHDSEYWVQSSLQYNKTSLFHSFIYSKSDVKPQKRRTKRSNGPKYPYSTCEDKLPTDAGGPKGEEPKSKRSAFYSNRIYPNRVCSVYLQFDHLFYNHIYETEGLSDPMTTRRRLEQIAQKQVALVNKLYAPVDFEGVRNVQFTIAGIKIWKSPDDYGYPFDLTDSANELLEQLTTINHNNYCVGYAFTYRNIKDNIQGLTFPCEVCLKFGARGPNRSHNVGILTFRSEGEPIPLNIIYFNFAHELGHNLGATHDTKAHESPECRSHFIMYEYANSGNLPENFQFSPCSLRAMSDTLNNLLRIAPGQFDSRQNNCFLPSSEPICGNGIVEPGEECDCGYNDQECLENGDPCCMPGNEAYFRPCKLRQSFEYRNKQYLVKCSPSQGECCSETCNFRGEGQQCGKTTECAAQSFCDGRSFTCPAPIYDSSHYYIVCGDATGTCDEGECTGSLCAIEGLKECESPDQTCFRYCEVNGVCTSTELIPAFSGPRYNQKDRIDQPGVMKRVGAFCMDGKGVCDASRKCVPRKTSSAKKSVAEKAVIYSISFVVVVLIAIAAILFYIRCRRIKKKSAKPEKSQPAKSPAPDATNRQKLTGDTDQKKVPSE